MTSAIENFSNQLRGRLIDREHENYDDRRTIYNAMIDKRPRFIAECTNVADVMAAVSFGRRMELETAVRGGGHNGAGLALVDDGLVIDLSRMKGIRVDPDARTARVEPGCVWGDVDHATHAFGLATVSGVISTTGVPGLTLGGGHGYLTRKHGLTVDNLLSADVVLANGRLVHASENENADLFWALRGGGGNFGVVTSFEFRLHEVKNVIGGITLWRVADIDKVLGWYRGWLPQADEDTYAFFLAAEVAPAPTFPEHLHGQKVCGLMWCHTGSERAARAAVKEARKPAEPLFEHVDEMPYPVLQTMYDDLLHPGLQWYWKGAFVREIPDEAVAVHAELGKVPTTLSTMHMYPIDGAAHRKNKHETAWYPRDANWSMVIAGIDPSPAEISTITDWACRYWEAIHPHTLGGAYVNFMMDEGDERVRASYGGNFERLRKIKAKYDPHNFFHVNQNIPPAR